LEKLHASSVLNMERLRQIGRFIDPEVAVMNASSVLASFAFTLIAAPTEDHKDRVLTEYLTNSCYGSRPSENEKFLKWLALGTGSDLGNLRKFAKQCRIPLTMKWF
jgi:hypothetical protein